MCADNQKLNGAFRNGAYWALTHPSPSELTSDEVAHQADRLHPLVRYEPRVFTDDDGRSWRWVDDRLELFDTTVNEADAQIGWRAALAYDSMLASAAAVIFLGLRDAPLHAVPL